MVIAWLELLLVAIFFGLSLGFSYLAITFYIRKEKNMKVFFGLWIFGIILDLIFQLFNKFTESLIYNLEKLLALKYLGADISSTVIQNSLLVVSLWVSSSVLILMGFVFLLLYSWRVLLSPGEELRFITSEGDNMVWQEEQNTGFKRQ